MRDDDKSTLVQRPGADAFEAPVAASLGLVVTAGPDAGRRLETDALGPARVLVGKSPVCELRLTDELVSRRHVAVELSPLGMKVTDLGSKNGTFVGGVRIVEAYVAPGDTISLGASTLVVQAGPPSIGRLTDAARFGRMIGASEAMRRIYPLCEKIAKTDLSVLIEGETGTGKEVLAEALHEASPRAQKPFIVYDCTAVPSTLIESALFGHERGAFTGATESRAGVFEQADGGTLLIDEIGELDHAVQPKLLRALERGEIQRVGGRKWISVDVRVIAATRRDLDAEVHAGRFRDDLFYRLAVARIELPPLRERHGDIGLLTRHLWRQNAGRQAIPTGLVERYGSYSWPGNVRELANTVLRAIALGDVTLPVESPLEDSAPSADDAMDRVLAQDLPLGRARELVVEEFERRYVRRVLERHGGNVVRAAAASGVARRYFQVLKARQK